MNKLLIVLSFLLLSCNAAEVSRQVGTTIMPDRLDITRGAGEFTPSRGVGSYEDQTWAVTIGWDLFTLDEDYRHQQNKAIFQELVELQKRNNELLKEPSIVYVKEEPEEPMLGPEPPSDEFTLVEKIITGISSLIITIVTYLGVKGTKNK